MPILSLKIPVFSAHSCLYSPFYLIFYLFIHHLYPILTVPLSSWPSLHIPAFIPHFILYFVYLYSINTPFYQFREDLGLFSTFLPSFPTLFSYFIYLYLIYTPFYLFIFAFSAHSCLYSPFYFYILFLYRAYPIYTPFQFHISSVKFLAFSAHSFLYSPFYLFIPYFVSFVVILVLSAYPCLSSLFYFIFYLFIPHFIRSGRPWPILHGPACKTPFIYPHHIRRNIPVRACPSLHIPAFYHIFTFIDLSIFSTSIPQFSPIGSLQFLFIYFPVLYFF